MKKLLFASIIIFVTFAMMVIGCTGCYNNGGYGYNQSMNNQMITDPYGNRMVVVNDGGSSFLMDYILWSSLMNRGGYGSVHNYYSSHSGQFQRYQPNSPSYRNWKTSTFRNSYQGSQPQTKNGTFRNSYQRNTNTSTSSPWRSTTPRVSAPNSSWRSSSSGGSVRSSGSSWRSSSSSSSSGSSFRSSGSSFRSRR